MKNYICNPAKIISNIFVIFMLVFITGCASQHENYLPKKPIETNRDPLEQINRVTFGVNTVADTVIVQPIARIYRNVIPSFGRNRINSFMFNLREPNNFANSLLQAKFGMATKSALRFLINSTIGLAGLFDVAKNMGLDKNRQSFGDTLRSWGVASGPYFVIPVLGPSTFADAIGRAVDYVMDPLNIWAYIEDYPYVAYSRTALESLDNRANLLDATDKLQKGSIDYYAAVRSAYYQYNNNWGDNYISSSSKDKNSLKSAEIDEFERLLNDDKT